MDATTKEFTYPAGAFGTVAAPINARAVPAAGAAEECKCLNTEVQSVDMNKRCFKSSPLAAS
jgi:hypothetical protein